MATKTTHPSLFSIILLSVGTMVGSGWLFACYYASKEAGPLSIFSWIIGAALMLLMALLLCELTIKFPKRNGLFTNLVSLSHNTHIGFILSLGSWLLGLAVVSSEAIATVQYLSGLKWPLLHHLFTNEHLTISGIIFSIFFMILYMVLNFWGVQLLAKANNVVTIIKILIPFFVVIVFAWAVFPLHGANYSLHHHMAGIQKTQSLFSTIINSGIFYSFFGFQAAASFASELRNPERSLPIALISSIVIVLVMYLALQIVFIGVLPTDMLNGGWAALNMQSPLAQLSTLLGLNFLTILLYVDSAISPSGTGIVYLGVTARIFNEMVKDGQMPESLGTRESGREFSRASLIISVVISSIAILFFNNWQLIASLMTTFIILSCLGLPIGHARLNIRSKNFFSKRFIPFPQFFSLFLFLVLSYLLLISGIKNLIAAAAMQWVFYIIYALTKERQQDNLSFVTIFQSAWSLLGYLLIVPVFAVIQHYVGGGIIFYIAFFIAMAGAYYVLVRQKDYTPETTWSGAIQEQA
jgi:amino acid transporter